MPGTKPAVLLKEAPVWSEIRWGFTPGRAMTIKATQLAYWVRRLGGHVERTPQF